MNKLPTWLEEILVHLLAFLFIALGIGLIVLVVIAVKYPATYMNEYPNRDCAITLTDDRLYAPAHNWVLISLSTNGHDHSSLPGIYVNDIVPTQHPHEMRAPIGWDPAKITDQPIHKDDITKNYWVREYRLPPGKWLQVIPSPVQPLTVTQHRNRHMEFTPKGFSKIDINWVCATPLLTFALLIELIGIALALFDFTGQAKRLEHFLDRSRDKYRSWLFPWLKAKTSVRSEEVANEEVPNVDDDFSIITYVLLFAGFILGTFLYTLASTQGEVSLWYLILYIGSITLLFFVFKFLAKWILGCLIFLLWVVLDKAPTGTVGGIGLSLLIYGLVSNYYF